MPTNTNYDTNRRLGESDEGIERHNGVGRRLVEENGNGGMEAQDEYIEKDMLEKRQYMQIVHDGEGEEARGREYTSIFELSEHGVASEWSNGNEADVEKGVEVEVEVDTDLVRRELQVSQLLSSSQNAYNKGFEYDQNVQVVRSIVFH